jgi:hypothetical protein
MTELYRYDVKSMFRGDAIIERSGGWITLRGFCVRYKPGTDAVRISPLGRRGGIIQPYFYLTTRMMDELCARWLAYRRFPMDDAS